MYGSELLSLYSPSFDYSLPYTSRYTSLECVSIARVLSEFAHAVVSVSIARAFQGAWRRGFCTLVHSCFVWFVLYCLVLFVHVVLVYLIYSFIFPLILLNLFIVFIVIFIYLCLGIANYACANADPLTSAIYRTLPFSTTTAISHGPGRPK